MYVIVKQFMNEYSWNVSIHWTGLMDYTELFSFLKALCLIFMALKILYRAHNSLNTPSS